ncbi:MAG TPA: hypothetical protein VGE12_10635 [Noviherbaspirillum sp.]
MYDRPPPGSALHRLRHDELCIITIDDKELEATWSANIYRFYIREGGDARTVGWGDVEEWRPASMPY